jgi:hypothetical protein
MRLQICAQAQDAPGLARQAGGPAAAVVAHCILELGHPELCMDLQGA